jgi:hypothetical protein
MFILSSRRFAKTCSDQTKRVGPGRCLTPLFLTVTNFAEFIFHVVR